MILYNETEETTPQDEMVYKVKEYFEYIRYELSRLRALSLVTSFMLIKSQKHSSCQNFDSLILILL